MRRWVFFAIAFLILTSVGLANDLCVGPGESYSTLQDAINAAVEGDIVSQEWCARYNGPGNNNDKSRAIATDGCGNVYVTGSSYGVGTGQDYGTVKYDTEGNMLWAVRYNGPGNTYDSATDLAVDGSGNVYVTGESVGIDNKMDYATIKYDTNGSQLWVARYTESANTEKYARAIAIDSLGNVYVTGFAYYNSADWVTIKYSPTGEQLWVDTFNGAQEIDDKARDIVVDGSGCVYVTGTSNSLYSLIWMWYMAADYATIKYSSDGVRQWVATYDGPGNTIDVPSSMVLDNSSNVYVTGGSDGNYATIKYDSTNGNQLWVARDYPGSAVTIGVDVAENVYISGTHHDASGFDYATIKYDSNGNQLWASTYDGPRNGIDQAYAMAVDESGNAYVTGESFGTDSGSDYATIKYDTEGNELWVARYDGPTSSADWATAITLDGWGNIYVTGGSLGAATYDYATIKYLQHPAVLEVPGEYSTIQAAIDVAVDGDVVIVEPGTYYENINFNGKNIVLTSTDPNDSAVVASTIIDGGGLGSTVTFAGGEDASCVLTGFTITNGYAEKGGGIYCGENSSPTILCCTISANSSSSRRGSIGVSGIFCTGNSPVISHCTISGNVDLPYMGRRGVAIVFESSNATINNCIISENMCSGIICGGQIRGCIISGNEGTGISCRDGTVITDSTVSQNAGTGISCRGTTVSNCTISGNEREGIYCGDNTTVSNCTVSGNGRRGIHCGDNNIIINCIIMDNIFGGVSFVGDDSKIINSIIARNTADEGAGIYCSWRYNTIVAHCTISGNSSIETGGGIHCNASTIFMSNCILWGNTAPKGPEVYVGSKISNRLSRISVWYNDVQGGEAGVYKESWSQLRWFDGNKSSNPRFVSSSDYHLQNDSPCIDTGTNNPWGISLPATDLDGKARIHDGNRDGIAIVDMGAYEFREPPDCSGAYPSIGEIWPPNHEWVEVEVLGVRAPGGDPIVITITGITQDEPVVGQGSGNTCPDGNGIGTSIATVRAESSGQGNGRVYEISFETHDSSGGVCNGTVQVCVPHDKGKGDGCVDDGQIYDSAASDLLSADLNRDGSIGYLDLFTLTEHWLKDELSADIAPAGGDNIVDFMDWAVLTRYWLISYELDY